MTCPHSNVKIIIPSFVGLYQKGGREIIRFIGELCQCVKCRQKLFMYNGKLVEGEIQEAA